MNRKHRLLNYFILLTCIILLNSGCAGMVGRSMMVGDLGSYSELSDSLSAIPEGKGRVFIYMTDGGGSLMNTMGVVGEPLSIDNDVYFFAGETFFFVDLDIGKHKITATNMTSGFVKRTFHLGENALDIVISNQDVKYISPIASFKRPNFELKSQFKIPISFSSHLVIYHHCLYAT